jgi:hypothetical protein
MNEDQDDVSFKEPKIRIKKFPPVDFSSASNASWHSQGTPVQTDPVFLDLMDPTKDVTQEGARVSSLRPCSPCQSDEDSGDDEYPPEWYIQKYGF